MRYLTMLLALASFAWPASAAEHGLTVTAATQVCSSYIQVISDLERNEIFESAFEYAYGESASALESRKEVAILVPSKDGPALPVIIPREKFEAFVNNALELGVLPRDRIYDFINETTVATRGMAIRYRQQQKKFSATLQKVRADLATKRQNYKDCLRRAQAVPPSPEPGKPAAAPPPPAPGPKLAAAWRFKEVRERRELKFGAASGPVNASGGRVNGTMNGNYMGICAGSFEGAGFDWDFGRSMETLAAGDRFSVTVKAELNRTTPACGNGGLASRARINISRAPSFPFTNEERQRVFSAFGTEGNLTAQPRNQPTGGGTLIFHGAPSAKEGALAAFEVVVGILDGYIYYTYLFEYGTQTPQKSPVTVDR